jgi:hypothetical protein
MVRRANEVTGVEIVHLHTEGAAPYLDPKYANNFKGNFLFVGANCRKAVQEGRASYTPVFLSGTHRCTTLLLIAAGFRVFSLKFVFCLFRVFVQRLACSSSVACFRLMLR